jgi:hypothetical protein
MGRRAFITLVGGPGAWPLAARARQPRKLPTIAFLSTTTPTGSRQWMPAFVQRLRELGWIEDRTTLRRRRRPPDDVPASHRHLGFGIASADNAVDSAIRMSPTSRPSVFKFPQRRPYRVRPKSWLVSSCDGRESGPLTIAVSLIAFARQIFETITIKDFNVAAPVLNQTGRLERTSTRRHGSASHAEDMRKRILSQRHHIGLRNVLRLQQPAAQARRYRV